MDSSDKDPHAEPTQSSTARAATTSEDDGGWSDDAIVSSLNPAPHRRRLWRQAALSWHRPACGHSPCRLRSLDMAWRYPMALSLGSSRSALGDAADTVRARLAGNLRSAVLAATPVVGPQPGRHWLWHVRVAHASGRCHPISHLHASITIVAARAHDNVRRGDV